MALPGRHAERYLITFVNQLLAEVNRMRLHCCPTFGGIHLKNLHHYSS